MTQQPRQSNIELLRLIAMLFIVIHHFIAHGLGLTQFLNHNMPPHIASNTDMLVFGGINCVCIIAVNLFFLISGYFGIKFGKEKLFNLLFQLFFYTLFFTTLPFILIGVDKGRIINSLFFYSNSSYWFPVVYALMMCLAPLFNTYFEHATKQQLKTLCIVLLVASCYCSFVWNNDLINSSGFSLFQFMTMYSIGRYFRLYPLQYKRRTALFAFLLFTIVMWLSQFYFYCAAQGLTQWSPGHPQYLAYKVIFYNSPLVVGAAVAFFLFFLKLNIQSNLINTLAKSAFAIYLLQESGLRYQLYNYIGTFKDNHSIIATLLFALLFAATFFLLAIIIDPLRRWISNAISRRLFQQKRQRSFLENKQ